MLSKPSLVPFWLTATRRSVRLPWLRIPPPPPPATKPLRIVRSSSATVVPPFTKNTRPPAVRGAASAWTTLWLAP